MERNQSFYTCASQTNELILIVSQNYNNISYRFYNSIRESGVPKNGIKLPQLFQQSTLVIEVASLFDHILTCDCDSDALKKYQTKKT